jgi:DnaJ-domain-containing protein 1
MLFVLAILVIIFGSPLLGKRRRQRQERRNEGDRSVDSEQAAMLEQIARLEERVKVLERIVTDDPNDLRRQFRALKD